MKVKDAKEILKIVKSFNFDDKLKSLRNNCMTVKDEIKIMEKTLENKSDEETLNSGLANSFKRMQKQYEYLKDL